MALVSRIVIAGLATFIFGIAALMFGLPFMFGFAGSVIEAILAGTGLVMIGFGLYLVFVFVAMVRTHITLAPAALEATVVAGHNRLLVPHFRSVRVAVADIHSVERRSEIFQTLGLSTERDALSVVTADGARIGLFSNTFGSLDTLPLDDVASALAGAAGVAVTDDGTVWTHGWGLYGAASSSWTERPLDAAGASKAQRAVRRTLLITTTLLLLTFVLRAFL